MSDDLEIVAYLQSQRLDETARYVRRGRLLVGLDDEELRRQWVLLFKQWIAEYGSDHDHQERDDIESELQLRGLVPPFDRVTDELAVMREKSKAYTDALLRDPERVEQLEQSLIARLEAFRRGIKNAN
jgi:hypothetical protein